MALGALERAKRRRLPSDGQPRNPRSATAKSHGLQGWRFFLVELVIVFLGVFGAAIADDWRQQRQEREQTRLLTANVVRTLDGLIRHDERVRAPMQQRVDAFARALETGQRPAYVYLFRRGARGVPTVGWDILLGAGGANRLPPDEMYELGMFFATLESLADQYARYVEFLEAEVLPHRSDAAHFYVEGSNRLKPEYRENLERLRDILGLEATLAERARKLRARLERISGPGPLAAEPLASANGAA